MKRWLLLLVVIPAALIMSRVGIDGDPRHADARPHDTFKQYYDLLGRGINLGNALEAPREGEWGVTLEEEYFERIRAAGFHSVRIPIRWSAHAKMTPPYTIDESFFRRVDWAIEQAMARKLAVVINMHHYEEMATEPRQHRRRFLGLWRQISRRYRRMPPLLCFELLNEPNGELTPELWNDYLRDALAVIRKTNPRRIVIVGPTHWNQISHLRFLELPRKDRQLVVTVHCYDPFQFTHQGAEWVDGSQAWLGTTWNGTEQEKKVIRDDLDFAVHWARENNRPLFFGEFGSYSQADLASRVRWTQFLRQELERREIPWAYWEFAAGFGIYDPDTNQWREPLLSVLIPD